MLSEIFDKLNRPKTYLLLANIFLVIFLIVLSNLHILPGKNLGDFIFFTLVYLAFALYRPGWSFLFFVGTIILENINLAPQEVSIMVRPYQFIGGLTILAVLIKLSVGRLGFTFPKWNRYDLLFVFFAAAGFLSALFAVDKGVSLKQSVIAASFVALYFLTRVFIQNLEDLKRVVPFFLSSSVIVALYGIWQNILFKYALTSFEVMPGRPNATFTEPDWLGIYLVLLLAVEYTLIYYFNKKSDEGESVILNFKFLILKQFLISNFIIFKTFLYALLVLVFTLLIITVSRSAWLGAFAVTFIYLFAIWTNLKLDPTKWEWRFAIFRKLEIIGVLIVSLFIVYIFHLTNFQIFNRAQSTGGLQKITVSCAQNILLPEKIEMVSELAQFGCRHIDLEEIQAEKIAGNFVTEIFRPDPNVNIRAIIYQKSWNQIKHHPIMGIGWGSIGQILGTDERGTGLNSSNIFLETWLGTGILGLLAFVIILAYVFISSIQKFSDKQTALGLFCLLGFFAILIPNLFNAGIMLGFVWVFLAINAIKK